MKKNTQIIFGYDLWNWSLFFWALVVNLLELIRVKKAIIQTIRPVEYKHLPVNLNTDN